MRRLFMLPAATTTRGPPDKDQYLTWNLRTDINAYLITR